MLGRMPAVTLPHPIGASMQKVSQAWQCRHNRTRLSISSTGFTLPETLAVLTMMGVITALSAPAWQAYHNRVMLSIGQDQVLQIMRQAQTKSELHNVGWQASFREVNGRVQGAVHPSDALPNEIPWENLHKGLRIDAQRTSLLLKTGVYRVRFDHYGNVNGQLGRLTLRSRDNSRLRSCVITSTLVGALRTARETKPSDKQCSPARLK